MIVPSLILFSSIISSSTGDILREKQDSINYEFSKVELGKQSNIHNIGRHYTRKLTNNSFPFDYDSLPKASNSMKDLNIILDLLKRGIPFGYSHFNDGEINAIYGCKEGESTDWGWQNCSSGLKRALVQSMRNTAPNFYIGLTEFIYKLLNLCIIFAIVYLQTNVILFILKVSHVYVSLKEKNSSLHYNY